MTKSSTRSQSAVDAPSAHAHKHALMLALLASVSLALAAALVCVYVMFTAIGHNERRIAANQQTITQLAQRLVKVRHAASTQRQLSLALQRQVRDCQHHRRRCGPPLTAAPSPQTARALASTADSEDGGSSNSPGSQPSPSRSPRPSDPPSSPQPSPSPSPTVCIRRVICLGPA